MRKQFVQTMTEIMEKDQNPYLLLGDIGVYGFRHILEKYPERSRNIGICEQAMVSVAAGLSMVGFNPIIHSIAPFLVERAYEQIKIDFGYNLLGGNFVSVGASYDYDALGSTHHCPADVAILQQIPNMQIVVPGTAKEFDILFQESYGSKQPTYFRLSEYANDESLDVGFGKVLPLYGTDSRFTVLVTGPALSFVQKSGLLYDANIKVLYCTTVNPFSPHSIGPHISSNKLMVVEPYYSSGITETIMNTFPGLTVVSVCPAKQFINVGYDFEKVMIAKILNTVRSMRW
jgi:transketolase